MLLRYLCFLISLLFSKQTPTVNGKIFERCELARSLVRHGIPYTELADWMCLIEGESHYNTQALNKFNADGSYDWGLFQINDRYWCRPDDGRASSNACRLSCQQLLSDNISHAVSCARYIKQKQGFSAWVVWNSRCQGVKPSVRHCFRRYK